MERSNLQGKRVRRAVYMPDELHEILTDFAARKNASPSTIILAAIEDTYEDDIDAIGGEPGLDEYLADPASSMTIEDLIRRGDEASA